jgi:hypothetical protein
MVLTTISQLCQAVTDLNGQLRFKIDSTVILVAPGDLPHAEIFVMRINAATDPKADTFMRIATVLDLTTLRTTREDAVSIGATAYLTSTFSVSYPDLNQATEAKKLIQARIDRLIADWKKYNTAFTANSTTNFPMVPTNIIQAKIDAFSAAKIALTSADATKAAADADWTLKDALATSANNALVTATQDSIKCSTLSSSLGAIITAESTFRTAAGTLLTTLGTQLPAVRDIQVQLEAIPQASTQATDLDTACTALETAQGLFATAKLDEYTTGATALAGLSAALSTSCGEKTAALNSAALAKSNADAAKATAGTTKAVAGAAASAAQATYDDALAAVLEVCPTFDPNSV